MMRESACFQVFFIKKQGRNKQKKNHLRVVRANFQVLTAKKTGVCRPGKLQKKTVCGKKISEMRILCQA
jgi:hypothetical protein